MKAKHFLIADTETIGLQPVNFVYDFGYVITTKKDIKLERSFLIREIVTDADKMMGAYFAKKIFTFYIPALDQGIISIFDWSDVVKQLRDDMEEFNIEVFCAYNLPFDMSAIRATNDLLANGGKVLNYKPDLLDLYYWATSGALNSRLYHDMCRQQEAIHQDNEWITKANNVRTTAEKAYAFLSGDINFIESHTALHDAQIETIIFQKLMQRKKPIPYNRLPGAAWRYAQTIEGTLLDKVNKIST